MTRHKTTVQKILLINLLRLTGGTRNDALLLTEYYGTRRRRCRELSGCSQLRFEA